MSISRFEGVKHFLCSNSFHDSNGGELLYPGLLVEVIRQIQAFEATDERKREGQSEAVEWMEVGKLVKKENEVRLEGGEMSVQAVGYIQDGSD